MARCPRGHPAGVHPPAHRPTGERPDEYAHLAPPLAEFAALAPADPRREELRNRLVAAHLPVARNIARRFARRGEPVEDLEQAGTIGLIGAVDRYDPARSIDFLSFAVPTITREIRRHFRDHTWAMWLPRQLKDLQSTLACAAARWPGSWAGPAPVGDRGAAADAGGAGHRGPRRPERLPQPLPRRVGTRRAAGPRRPDARGRRPLGAVEYREMLGPLLDSLPERDRTIVVLRFLGNRTQTQIAEIVGISRMHVPRLLDRTLTMLRRRLTADE